MNGLERLERVERKMLHGGALTGHDNELLQALRNGAHLEEGAMDQLVNTIENRLSHVSSVADMTQWIQNLRDISDIHTEQFSPYAFEVDYLLNEARRMRRRFPGQAGAGRFSTLFGSGKGSRIQSVLFPKSDWKEAAAKAWLKGHDLKSSKVDKTDEYLRFRQEDPDNFSRIRTKVVKSDGKQISLLIGFPNVTGGAINNRGQFIAQLNQASQGEQGFNHPFWPAVRDWIDKNLTKDKKGALLQDIYAATTGENYINFDVLGELMKIIEFIKKADVARV